MGLSWSDMLFRGVTVPSKTAIATKFASRQSGVRLELSSSVGTHPGASFASPKRQHQFTA